MPAFDGFRVKDRSAKVAKRRGAMVVTNRSIFVIEAVKVTKGRKAAERLAARKVVR